jgi:predicted GIY-YIG superfamily endonuclease
MTCEDTIKKTINAFGWSESEVSSNIRSIWFDDYKTMSFVYRPVVYFLTFGDEILYVGSSANLKQRLQTHHLKRKILAYQHKKVRVYYVYCNMDIQYNAEHAYIRHLKPIWNKEHRRETANDRR